jgi:hypothetical protein
MRVFVDYVDIDDKLAKYHYTREKECLDPSEKYGVYTIKGIYVYPKCLHN